MEKDNYRMWIWVIVAVVVLGGIFFFISSNQEKETDTITTPNKVVTDTNTDVKTEPESAQDTTGTVGAGAVSISYAQALVKYADRRIQLDKTCQARPNNVTYKDNTGIMIDNRSPETRTVKVGTTYTIKPYGFKIVVLPDIYLKAKTILVDCDQSQNVATILVQE